MRTDLLSFEALLHGAGEELFHPADARRRLARWAPQLVAEQLAGPVEPAQRDAWAARFGQELWPALQAERGNRWDLGWEELVAGFAVAIELLVGALPASVRSVLEGSPAHPLWERWRRPHLRYTLLIDA